MTEYTKLTSDDNNISYTSKFLSEKIPFGDKLFLYNAYFVLYYIHF